MGELELHLLQSAELATGTHFEMVHVVISNGWMCFAEYSKIFMSHWVVSSIGLLEALDVSAPDTARLNFTPISIEAERGRAYFATQVRPTLALDGNCKVCLQCQMWGS